MINREDLLSGTRPEVGSRILVTEKKVFKVTKLWTIKVWYGEFPCVQKT